MRDHLLLYVNGRPHTVTGDAAFLPLSTYLRTHLNLPGTKVVCAEGDCGACTVLIAKPTQSSALSYLPVNACIQYLFQLDGASVLTVESLENSTLHPLQQSFIDCHASQCGYCTPGFVMSLAALCEKTGTGTVSLDDARDAVTGNLCRCTGYLSILEAAQRVTPAACHSLAQRYHSEAMLAALTTAATTPVEIRTPTRHLHKPVTLAQAIAFRAQHPHATLYAGGTDLAVRMNKGHIAPTTLLTLSDIPTLNHIALTDDEITAGPTASWSQFEHLCREKLPEFHRILTLFGSPQIRNAGTIAGNIANASPIADSLPLLYALGAELELTGPAGPRTVLIQSFYKGYKQLDLNPDEIITQIRIPLPQPAQTLKLYKVSRRKHLDISTFTAAFLLTKPSETIDQIRIAYGGVGPTVLRLPRTESFLTGHKFTEPLLTQAADVALSEITPLSDVRGAAAHRNRLAANVLKKLYHDCVESDCVGAHHLTDD